MKMLLITNPQCIISFIIKLKENPARIKKFVSNYTEAKLNELNAILPAEYHVRKGQGKALKAPVREVMSESVSQPSPAVTTSNTKPKEEKVKPTAAEIFEKRRAALENNAANLTVKITTLRSYYKTTTQTTEITNLIADEIEKPVQTSKVDVAACKFPDDAKLNQISTALSGAEKKIIDAETQIRAVANVKQSINEFTTETKQLAAEYKGISSRTILKDKRYQDLKTKVTELDGEMDAKVHTLLTTGTQELTDAVYSAVAIQTANALIEKIKLELRPFRNRIKTLRTQITKEERNWKPLQ